MLNVGTIKVPKMTSHCTQMRKESESGIRKWEEMWFKTTAEERERERAGSRDVRWKTVPQTSCCPVADSGQTSRPTSIVQRRWWGRT